jgi:uridine kinase
MKDMIKINVMNEEVEVKIGTTLLELASIYQYQFQTPIVLAIVDTKLSELNQKIKEPCNVVFLDILNKDGFRTYQRSLSFVMIKAAHDVIGHEEHIKVIVQYSINYGFFCEIEPKRLLKPNTLAKIKERMIELINLGLPFVKETVKTDDAIKIFENQFMEDKVKLFKYRRVSNVNLYRFDGFYDYFYGYMVPDTSYLKVFELHPYEDGMILQFIDFKDPSKAAHFEPDQMLFETLKNATDWGHLMEVDTVGDLNDVISQGKMNELIMVQEALMEKKIGRIADRIMKDIKHKKFVFIAGPSSSGKTTFAHRLSIQLRSLGLRPMPISLDNYFVNREDTPLDEKGIYNFECLEALDIAQFNLDMHQLLEGKTVSMPSFDFISGLRQYKGDTLMLEDNTILVIEGIHGLNPKLSSAIPEENKYKIYISALTQLNIDNHNRVPTTDARLLRRMVRDNQFRGASATKTLGMWPSVRNGEEQYIFPFQEEADAMFNSSLIYELSVLKQYAEPLLFNVPRASNEYLEAKRLIKFLDYFLGVSSESIPNNSIIREFIGGSNFR